MSLVLDPPFRIVRRPEGGRWFWLQHEMVARGAAFVRPRRENLTRTDDLLPPERAPRTGKPGL